MPELRCPRMSSLSIDLPAELVASIREAVLVDVRADLERREPSWPEWLRDATAASYADVAARTVKRWRRAGELPYSVAGGVCVTRRSDLDRFLSERAYKSS
jgi:hypothetical protein